MRRPYTYALATGVALAFAAAWPVLGREPPAALQPDSRLSLLPEPALGGDASAQPIRLRVPQTQPRFLRNGPQASVSLGPRTTLFVQSQKFRYDAGAEATAGLAAVRGKSYAVGVALRW
jgi:hypothetical protein